MKPTETNEPEAMSGIFDELMEGLEEALLWTKGEKMLKTTTLTIPDEDTAASPKPVRPTRKTKRAHKAEPEAAKL